MLSDMKNVVELARRLMERGIDVVDVLLTALSREDPEVFIIICSVYFC
ncbi:MAG: hypothetical protein RXQ00_05745 [Caldivirga sp.]